MTESQPSIDDGTNDGKPRLTVGQLTALAGHRNLNEQVADTLATLRTIRAYDPEPTRRAVAAMARWSSEQTRADMNRIAANIAKQFSAQSAVSESLTLALATLPRPDLSTLQTALQEAGGTSESWAAAAAGMQLLAETDGAEIAPNTAAVLVSQAAADVVGDAGVPELGPAAEVAGIRFAPEDIELLRGVAAAQAAEVERAQAEGKFNQWLDANRATAWLVAFLIPSLLALAALARDFYDVTATPPAAPATAPAGPRPQTLVTDLERRDGPPEVDRESTD